MTELGLPDSILEHLPGYLAWLPNLTVELHADTALWRAERARVLGDSNRHRKFWALLDDLAGAYAAASRRGARMPIRNGRDLVAAARSIPPRDWALLRYLRWTLDDALAWAGLAGDARLRAFMSMVVQDTVHSDPSVAPLVNSSLGLAIRGAIARPRGGMFGFWRAFEARVKELGVALHLSTAVESVTRTRGDGRGPFRIITNRGEYTADVIVCTLPIWDAARVGPPDVSLSLSKWCRRDESSLGGAALLTMGVPDEEVRDHTFTHHQFLPEPEASLGDGNNCFLSISSPDDDVSAPPGYRALMISTHVDIDGWLDLDSAAHEAAKQQLGDRMLHIARGAFPGLGSRAQWLAIASPRTYARFTRRHRGSVGGMRLTLRNSNQNAVPHNIGVKNWVQAGDTTWPGLGTTACAICSDIAATEAIRRLENHG